jgi:hypothetical protein
MPMPRRSSSVLLLVFAVAASAQLPQEEKPAALEGDVRNALTGAPVAHAHVTLMGGAKPQTYGAITDADGKFTMTGLPTGSYLATVARVGYVPATGPEAAAASRISLGAGDRKSEFHLTLVPAGSITGRVLDAAGEPVEGISVAVEGMSSNPMSSGAVTDDKGQFRVGGLAPRKYRVKASPMTMMPMPPEIRTDGTVEPNYVTTWFPNATETRSAGRVEVKPGEDVTSVDIRLVQMPPVRISGVVSGAAKGSRSTHVQLRKEAGMQNGVPVKPNGTFQLWRVAPGKYSLVARSNENGQTMSSVTVDIEVAGTNLDNLELRLLPSFDLPGVIIFDDEQAKGQTPPPAPPSQTQARQPGQQSPRPAPPPSRRIMLREIAGGMAPPQSNVAEDGTFRLTAISPGRFRVMPSWGRVYIKSMQLGQVHFDGAVLDLQANPGGATLEVVVSSAVAEISGTVSDSKGPVEGARVAIMPEGPDAFPTPMIAQTLAGGVYRFPNVTPGRYRLAATDDTSDFVWEDYEDVAVTVDVHPGDKTTKDLKRR